MFIKHLIQFVYNAPASDAHWTENEQSIKFKSSQICLLKIIVGLKCKWLKREEGLPYPRSNFKVWDSDP